MSPTPPVVVVERTARHVGATKQVESIMGMMVLDRDCSID